MRTIKHFLTLIIFFQFNNFYCQDFDGYKYLVIDNFDYISKSKDFNKISNKVVEYFNSKGYETIIGNDVLNFPIELKKNICAGLFVNYILNENDVSLIFSNCKRQVIKSLTGKDLFSYENSLSTIFNILDGQNYYTYNEKLTPTFDEVLVLNKIDKNEDEIKKYLDSNKIESIEGIYKSYKSDEYNKIAIIKDKDIYKAILLESNMSNWTNGEIKAEFESTSVDGVFSTKYYNADKKSIETFANIEGGLLSVELKSLNGEDATTKYLKLYPKK